MGTDLQGSEFIERYPELLQGMDVDRCRAVSNFSGTAIFRHLDINHMSEEHDINFRIIVL